MSLSDLIDSRENAGNLNKKTFQYWYFDLIESAGFDSDDIFSGDAVVTNAEEVKELMWLAFREGYEQGFYKGME